MALKVKVEAAGRNSFCIDNCARRRIMDRFWSSIAAGVVPLPNQDEGDVGKRVQVKSNLWISSCFLVASHNLL